MLVLGVGVGVVCFGFFFWVVLYSGCVLVCFMMGVLRLSGSGKALLVVLDSGEVLSVSVFAVRGLLEGRFRVPLVLTRLPFRVSPGRFPVSPLYQPGLVDSDRYGHMDDPMVSKDHVRKGDVLIRDLDVKL